MRGAQLAHVMWPRLGCAERSVSKVRYAPAQGHSSRLRSCAPSRG